MPDFAACRQTMLLYLKARIPFISVRTDERDRALVRDITTDRVVNEDRSVAGALDYASQQILQRQNLTFILTEVQDIDGDTPLSRRSLLCDRAGRRHRRDHHFQYLAAVAAPGTLVLDPPNEDEMRAIFFTIFDLRI